MKKITWIILLIFLITINFEKVKAQEMDYYLTCKEYNYNYYEKGSAQTINVERESFIYVTAVIDGNDSNYTLKSGKLTIRWDSNYMVLTPYEDNRVYTLLNSNFKDINISSVSQTKDRLTINFTANDNILNIKNKLMEFKFKVLSSAKVGLTKIYELDGEANITCQDANNNLINCGESKYSELSYNILSFNINTLSSIKIDGKEISGFNPNTNVYSLVVDTNKESINIEVTKEDIRSSVSGEIGTKKLDYGINTFNIVVTSESKIANSYTINVNRPDLRSGVNTLKTLKLSSGIINFKPDVNDYDVTVSNDVNNITITSSLEDLKAKYEVDYTKKEIELLEGINKIQIKVIAENGKVNIYTLNITRELSGNNTLRELKVNNEIIKLEQNVFNYELEVENEVTTVNIIALPTNEKSSCLIDQVDILEIGDNDIKISVTAPNGNKVSYNLNIYRKEILSSNSSLSDIKIEGYNLKFDKNTQYYYLKIKDEDTLNIDVIKEDESSKVEIEGNQNLINGAVIKINVIAEDSSITRYFINIEKNGKSNALLWIMITLFIVVIVTVIIILIMKRNDKKNNKKIEEVLDNKLESNEKVLKEVKKHDVTISSDDEKA